MPTEHVLQNVSAELRGAAIAIRDLLKHVDPGPWRAFEDPTQAGFGSDYARMTIRAANGVDIVEILPEDSPNGSVRSEEHVTHFTMWDPMTIAAVADLLDAAARCGDPRVAASALVVARRVLGDDA